MICLVYCNVKSNVGGIHFSYILPFCGSFCKDKIHLKMIFHINNHMSFDVCNEVKFALCTTYDKLLNTWYMYHYLCKIYFYFVVSKGLWLWWLLLFSHNDDDDCVGCKVVWHQEWSIPSSIISGGYHHYWYYKNDLIYVGSVCIPIPGTPRFLYV